jgi:hypothetical protein
VGPIGTKVGKDVASAVIHEAAEELSGRSNRKWAVMLVAFLIGIVAAVIIIKRRGGTLAIESDPRWTDLADANITA